MKRAATAQIPTAEVIDFPRARATRRPDIDRGLLDAVVTWMHEATGDLVDQVDIDQMCLSDFTAVKAAIRDIELYRAGKIGFGTKPRDIRKVLWSADFLLNTRLRLLSAPVLA